MKLQLLKITFVVAALILLIVWLSPGGCSKPIPQSNTSNLKDSINKVNVRRDSVKIVIKEVEKERIKYIVRWRDVKVNRDSLPCDSLVSVIINVCDTLIQKDSTEINALKKMVELDEFVIKEQRRVIVIDSVVDLKLRKEIRRHKRQKRLIVFGLGGLLGASLFLR